MSLCDVLMGRRNAAPVMPAPVMRREPRLSASGPQPTHEPGLFNIGWSSFNGSRVKTLPPVTPISAQRHGMVFACCNVIAGDLAKLPLKVYRRDPATGDEVRDRRHRAAVLMNGESAPGVAAVTTRFALNYAFCLRGNSFAYAPRDGAGDLVLVEAIRNDRCSVLKAGRDRYYDIQDGADDLRRVPARAMVHLRYLADDGWTGRSPIEIAAESVGLALAGQESAAKIVSGVLGRAYVKMSETYGDDEDYKRNVQRIAAGLRNPEVEGFPVLGPEGDIKMLDLSAADQQLLDSRKFDAAMILAIYRVPPFKAQMLEFGVKSSGEQQAIDYVTDCLMHWATQIEEQMGLALLTPGEREDGYFLRHDFDALLRPTTKERYEAHHRAVGGPWMTVNEARRKEGQPELADGDRLYPPPNMTRSDAPATEEDDDA